MTWAELSWRMQGRLRDAADRGLAWSRRQPPSLTKLLTGGDRSCRPESLGGHLPRPGEVVDFPEAWRVAAISEADRVLENRVRLLGESDCELGPKINWNRDYQSGVDGPVVPSSAIDYRDFSVTGDCKWVWELNRHHHLVVLGRGYRLTGDRRYAEAVAAQLDDWIEACPFGFGMNWRSPLELAIRLINWVWATELIRPSGCLTGSLEERVLGVVHRHLWDISRKYSRHSSANNHLIGEAAGVFIGSSYFGCFRDSERWRARSREILLRQIIEQTYPDGGSREQAFGYHMFVLQFFVLAGLCARHLGDEFPAAFWERLEKMFEFAAAFAEGGDSVPMFGDADDGYVLNLGGDRGDVRALLAVGALLFDRPDFKSLAQGPSEPAYWLLGDSAGARFDAIGEPDDGEIRSRALPESGYYLLQSGHRNGADRISVSFDCGELGFRSIAAHGHADALSITLRVCGEDILVDPGTYDYFTYRTWRDYFRGSKAHNTVVVDGLDQSAMQGAFLWGHRATAKCVSWTVADERTCVTGEHDGYSRLGEPVKHRRTVVLDSKSCEIRIEDEIIGVGRHDVALFLHFGEKCAVAPLSDTCFRVSCGQGAVELEFESRLEIATFRGCERPILGWMSRGYHRKRPSTSLVATCQTDGSTTLATVIRVLLPTEAKPGARIGSPSMAVG